MSEKLESPDKYLEADEEILSYLKEMSHDFHRLYSEVMREYVEKEIKLIDDTLNFGYKIIQVVGIVAGFGFTALGFVKSLPMFIVGEGLLIGSIVLGIHKIKEFYTTNLAGMQQARSRINKILRQKSQLFIDVFAEANKEGKINFGKFQTKLADTDSKILEEFSDKRDEPSKNEGRFLDVIILLLILGSVAFLLSFVDLPAVSWEKLIDLSSPKVTQSIGSYFNLPLDINWSSVSAIGTIIAAIFASLAACIAYKTWVLEKLPVVHAVGTFIISTDLKTNELRDDYIFRLDSPHTLQLVNVGRGPAKGVTPSVRRNVRGNFLEAVNPHSFSLPANKGTKELKEILQVHGQRFVRGDEYELEFENDRKMSRFYIHFEDHEGKQYLTKVKISKVEDADGELGGLIKTDGIEVWKVMENTKEEI